MTRDQALWLVKRPEKIDPDMFKNIEFKKLPFALREQLINAYLNHIFADRKYTR